MVEPNTQFVHYRVIVNQFSSFYFTAVCGSLVPSIWRILWRHLSRIRSFLVGAWVLMGDFNALASATERIGGSLLTLGVSMLFFYWLQEAGMVDLGYVGLYFT